MIFDSTLERRKSGGSQNPHAPHRPSKDGFASARFGISNDALLVAFPVAALVSQPALRPRLDRDSPLNLAIS